MADTPEPERELDGDAASKAVNEAFEKARANLRGGERGGKTMRLLRDDDRPCIETREYFPTMHQAKVELSHRERGEPTSADTLLGFEEYIRVLQKRVAHLEGVLNTPETHDFVKAVMLEAAHQRERWAADDPRKGDGDWFWLIGYLAGKALHTPIMKDCAEGLMFAPHAVILDKKLHRIITVAAAAANWHAFVSDIRKDAK